MEQRTQSLDEHVADLERRNRLLEEALVQAARVRRQLGDALGELERKRTALATANAHLTALYRIARAVASPVSVEVLLGAVLGEVRDIMSAYGALEIGVFLIDGERMRFAAGHGGEAGFEDAHRDLRVGSCLCGLAASEGRIIVAADCANDPRHMLSYRSTTPHAHLALPLQAAGRMVGVLYAYLPPDTALDAETRRMLETVGGHLGLGIEHAWLYQEQVALSAHDPLTGLANRRALEAALTRDIGTVQRYGGELAVIMMDLDHFKHFNDTRGHQAGDELLVRVAGILRNSLRESDLAVRYGGEEFLVLLHRADAERAREVAERMRATVAAETPVTVSAGVAAFRRDADNGHSLIARADAALYLAKQEGRNRVVVAA